MRTAFKNRLLAWMIEHRLKWYLWRKGLASHRIRDDAEFWRLHAKLIRAGEGVQRMTERYNLWALAHKMAAMPGDFAELGVYRGGSAKILCEAKGQAKLHL